MSLIGYNLETDRLEATPFEARHAEYLSCLYADRQVMEFLSPTGEPFSAHEVNIIAIRFAAHWDAHDFGPYAISLKGSDETIGYAGLRYTAADQVAEVELVYALSKEYWSDGLGTEISCRVLKQAFSDFGFQSVTAYTLPHNAASKRLLEKCGFVHERDGLYAGIPHAYFRVKGNQFKGSS